MENAVEGRARDVRGGAGALAVAEGARPRAAPGLRAHRRGRGRARELSWDVAAFLEARLTPAEREATHAARTAAIRELEGQLAAAVPLADAEAAGLPQPDQARALFASVASEVWGTTAA